MKINTSILKKEYSAYCAQRIDESRKLCLSPEKLILTARGELSDKEKSASLKHITECIYCSLEMKEILKILQYEKQIIEKIIKKPQKNNEKIFPGINWKTAAASAVLLLFVVSSFLIIHRMKNSHSLRGGSSQIFNLIAPVDTNTSEPYPVFKWMVVEQAGYYILEIYDEFLTPLWESRKLYHPRLQLPEEIVSSMKSGAGYYWMVTAYLTNGKTIESSLEKFVFRRIYR